MVEDGKLGYCYLILKGKVKGCEADSTIVFNDFDRPTEYGRLEFMQEDNSQEHTLVLASASASEPLAREAMRAALNAVEALVGEGKKLTPKNLWVGLCDHFEPLYLAGEENAIKS